MTNSFISQNLARTKICIHRQAVQFLQLLYLFCTTCTRTMPISCEVFNYQDTAIEDLSVTLQCIDHPEYRFEGRTDEDGAVWKWATPSGELLLVPWANAACHLRWEMVFNIADHLGSGAFFQQVRQTICLPTYESFHVKLRICHDRYAMTRHTAVQDHAMDSPGFLRVSPISPCPGLIIGPPLELERISGYSEPYSPSAEEAV